MKRRSSRRSPLTLATDARAASDAGAIPKALAGLLTRSPWLGFGAKAHAGSVEETLEPLLTRLRQDRAARHAPLIEDVFFEQGNEQRQPTAPWLIAPDLNVVTAFVIVANGLRRLLRDSEIFAGAISDIDRWTRERIGTIHTVQGREAEAVIFVLGAPNGDQTGARGWAGKEPNLRNVAVTRAKESVYVIGNRSLWRSAGVFSDLNAVLS